MISTLNNFKEQFISIKDLAKEIKCPPSEGIIASTQQLIPTMLTKGTRGYIERIANEINGSYERGWFNCCAVMMRRLIETMIIECYEAYNYSGEIKDANGDYLFLSDLISKVANQNYFHISRNVKQALPNLKKVGDLASHNRRYLARREDIDRVSNDFRICLEELLFTSKIKK